MLGNFDAKIADAGVYYYHPSCNEGFPMGRVRRIMERITCVCGQPVKNNIIAALCIICLAIVRAPAPLTVVPNSVYVCLVGSGVFGSRLGGSLPLLGPRIVVVISSSTRHHNTPLHPDVSHFDSSAPVNANTAIWLRVFCRPAEKSGTSGPALPVVLRASFLQSLPPVCVSSTHPAHGPPPPPPPFTALIVLSAPKPNLRD